jgi:hypothetical protein
MQYTPKGKVFLQYFFPPAFDSLDNELEQYKQRKFTIKAYNEMKKLGPMYFLCENDDQAKE